MKKTGSFTDDITKQLAAPVKKKKQAKQSEIDNTQNKPSFYDGLKFNKP